MISKDCVCERESLVLPLALLSWKKDTAFLSGELLGLLYRDRLLLPRYSHKNLFVPGAGGFQHYGITTRVSRKAELTYHTR